MAGLYFHYSTMNAGKSMHALTTAFNYKERNMNVLLFKPAIDTRGEQGYISSRTGLKQHCTLIKESQYVSQFISLGEHIDCIIVDEVQFLTAGQIGDLAYIVDILGIPVMCYGLRTDFKGELFEGSKRLFELADKLVEIKTICWCGKKATMVVRVNSLGEVIKEGEQVEVGGNESYVSLCRKHFMNNHTN